MAVEFELDVFTFTALNGGPVFKFNEAVSFEIGCKTQEGVDYYWQRLLTAATRRRNSAAGSRINTGFRRLCPRSWPT